MLNSAHSFTVTLVATDQHHNNVTGAGVALPQTDTFGYFSLPTLTNNPSNPEVFVKILDRPRHGGYWVFYGHLTDLIYDLTVTESRPGLTKTYHKDAGNTARRLRHDHVPRRRDDAGAARRPASSRPTRTCAPRSTSPTTPATTASTPSCSTATPTGGAFQGCTHAALDRPRPLQQLPPGRHRRLSRRARRPPAGGRRRLLRHAARHLPEPAVAAGLGGNGLGQRLQPRLGGRSAARHRRLRRADLLLLRVRDDVGRRHRPRHRSGAERAGRIDLLDAGRPQHRRERHGRARSTRS